MSLPQNSIALRAAPHRPGRKEKQERPLEKNEQQRKTAIFSSFGLLEKVNPSAERKFHGEKSVHLNTTINRSILRIKFDKNIDNLCNNGYTREYSEASLLWFGTPQGHKTTGDIPICANVCTPSAHRLHTQKTAPVVQCPSAAGWGKGLNTGASAFFARNFQADGTSSTKEETR